ncbi:MAG: hypothetical protein ABI036_01560 [Fibrobacteria bacterium]
MQKIKILARILILCVLGAASFNGLMVFILFDGTNYLTSQYYQFKKENEEDNKAIFDNHVKYLEIKIKETRISEKLKYKNKEKLLEEKYWKLDTLIHHSNLIYRNPISGKFIDRKIRSDNPFKIDNGVISICIRNTCFYEENLPSYISLDYFTDKNVLKEPLLGARLSGTFSKAFPLVFLLEKKSGPFELWEAYWQIGDSIYNYYSNYLINTNNRRLLKRDVSLEKEGVFMGEASASGKYLILDYGCCPGPRGLSILNEFGKLILTTTYIGDASWKNDTLMFYFPIEAKIEHEDKCSKAGLPTYSAWETYFINGRTVKTGEKKIYCGQ